jgi:hypothetical protein
MLQYSEWFKIDNNPTSTKQSGQHDLQSSKASRSFMPASQECFLVFSRLVEALKDCGLSNSHHDIHLSRGASWIRSKRGSQYNPLPQQTLHLDFDTTSITDRLQLPMSLFIYLQDTNLFIVDTVHQFSAGDIVLLLGDCPHAGGEWASSKVNYRLFCFLPTKKCRPTWESGCTDSMGKWRYHPNTSRSTMEDLRDTTDPLSDAFDLNKYLEHTFCAVHGVFFEFNVTSWYHGLQTICYQGI